MDRTARLTVVVAAFNEAQSLPLLHPRIAAVLDGLAGDGIDGRVLYVDDGSRDATWETMRGIAAADPRVSLLRLSRNFGKEAALTAGLDLVDEGAAMILDADGQDPPELIPQFVARWREGHDDVHGTRTGRAGESALKRGTAHLFYRVIGRLSHTPIPRDTGDFRLLSPRALAALRQLRERHRFMKGLFGAIRAWPDAASSTCGACGISPWKASPAFRPPRCGWPPILAWRRRCWLSCMRPGSWSRRWPGATRSPAGRR